jgi:hypothetical protein
MLDRVTKHNGVAAVPTTYAYGRFVRMLVVLDVGQRHPLGLEGVTELSIQQLDRDVVASPHFGQLVKQSVPVFPGSLVDQVPASVLRTPCHRMILALHTTEDNRAGCRDFAAASRADG